MKFMVNKETREIQIGASLVVMIGMSTGRSWIQQVDDVHFTYLQIRADHFTAMTETSLIPTPRTSYK